MPSKKKYDVRFPPAKIKKIIQTDEEIGRVAASVPVIISRTLELFLESLLKKACQVTQSRNAKTLTTAHLKQCIELEQQFQFLKDLVPAVPDMQGDEDNHPDGEKGSRSLGAAGKPAVPEARGKTRSSLGQIGSSRVILKTQRQMKRKRCHSPIPEPPAPFFPFSSTLPLPPAPPGPTAVEEEHYDS